MRRIHRVNSLLLVSFLMIEMIRGLPGSAAEIAVRLQDPAATRDREAPPMEARRIESSDGWFQARVPALLRSKESDLEGNERFLLGLEIGASRPIECRIERRPMDFPQYLKERSGDVVSTDSDVRALGRIEKHLPERTDVLAIGSTPAMGVEWLLVGQGPAAEKRMLGIHVLYAVKQGAGIGCVKVDVGYRDTFRRVFESLVEQFERSRPPEEASPVSIVRRTIGKFDIGLQITTVGRNPSRKHVVESLSYTLIPKPGGILGFAISRSVETIDAETLLLESQTRSLARDGKGTEELRLERLRHSQGWRVRGRKDNQSIEAVPLADGSIMSSLAFQQAVREALSAEHPLEARIESWEWSTRDPKTVVRMTTRVTALVDAATARISRTDGTEVIELVVERKTGQALSAVLVRDGRSLMRDERIYVALQP